MINQLGERLKLSRIRSGLSQEQAGELVGTKGQTISVYETGRGLPSLDIFLKLAARYKVSADWLLGLENDKTISVDNLPEEDIESIQHLVSKLRQFYTSSGDCI